MARSTALYNTPVGNRVSFLQNDISHPFVVAEVSRGERKMRGSRETSAGIRRVSCRACASVSLTTSDILLTCDTTLATGLRSKGQQPWQRNV